MSLGIEHLTGGTYNGSGTPESGNIGTLTTSGTNRLIVIALITGRDNTFDDVNTVNSITGTALTWTKKLHQTWLYQDSGADSGFPHAAYSIDIFTAPAAAAVTGQTWNTTWSGSFSNHGTGYSFAISGLADINNPWDTNVNGGITVTQTDAGAGLANPNITGINTSNGNDLIVGLLVSHRLGNATFVTPSGALSGWTQDNNIGNQAASGGASAHETLLQHQTFASPQSGLSMPSNYSDSRWTGIAMAFNGGAPPIKRNRFTLLA